MAAFGKGGILHLPFRKTRWHIATFTLAGNVLFYIKGASVSSSHSFCLNLSLCFPILFLTLFFGLSVLVRVSPVLLFYYLWFSGLSSVLYFSLDLTFVCLSFVACFLGLDFGFHIGHQLIKACFLFSTCLCLCACIWVLFWTVTTSINERDAAYYILADTVKHNAQLLGGKKNHLWCFWLVKHHVLQPHLLHLHLVIHFVTKISYVIPYFYTDFEMISPL